MAFLCGLAIETTTSGIASESVKFLKEESEILLSAKLGKWHKLFLRREYYDGTIVSYRWESHVGDRDRCGQGAFTRTIECLLHAGADQVRVVEAQPDRLQLAFIFHGTRSDSKLNVTAIKKEGKTSVRFEGGGELFDAFVKRLNAIRLEEGGEQPEELQWLITTKDGHE